MDTKKVCCFCESWESGGIESFLNNILLRMDLSMMQVDIIAAKIKPSVFTARLEARGVRFIELSSSLRSAKNYTLFRELIRKNKYDVIHFNLFQGLSLYYVHIAKQEGVLSRIAHSHNTELRKSPTRWMKIILHHIGRRLFTNSATELWACSSSAGEFLFGDKKEVRFIPNGIETEKFRFDSARYDEVRAELGLSDVFVVGTVGRLCYQKNQGFLIDAFAELVKLHPDSVLLLVGDGEQKEYLIEKSVRLGVSGKVIFCGVTDHVERMLWAMDAFAFPSLFEGLGIVAIEAQAAGLPVLCSENIPVEANITELFHVLPLNAEMWAQRLATLSSSDRVKYAEKVRKAGFDVAHVAEKLEKSWLR